MYSHIIIKSKGINLQLPQKSYQPLANSLNDTSLTTPKNTYQFQAASSMLQQPQIYEKSKQTELLSHPSYSNTGKNILNNNQLPFIKTLSTSSFINAVENANFVINSARNSTNNTYFHNNTQNKSYNSQRNPQNNPKITQQNLILNTGNPTSTPILSIRQYKPQQHQAYEQFISTLQKQIQTRQAQRIRLNKQIEDLKQYNRSLLDVIHAQRESSMKKNIQINEILQQQKDQNAKLNNDKRMLEQTIKKKINFNINDQIEEQNQKLELNKKYSECLMKVNQLKNQNFKLINQVQMGKRTIYQFQMNQVMLKKQLQVNKEKVNELNFHLEQRKSQYEDKQKTISQLFSALSLRQKQLKQLKEKSAYFQLQKISGQRSKKILIEQLNTFKSQQQTLSKQLTQKYEQLQHKLSLVTHQKQHYIHANSSLNTMINSLQQKFKEQINALKYTLQQKDYHQISLQEQNHHLKAQISHKLQQIANIKSQIQQFKQTDKLKTNQLEKKQKQLMYFKSTVISYEKDILMMTNRFEMYHQNYDGVVRKIQALGKQNDELNRVIECLRDEKKVKNQIYWEEEENKLKEKAKEQQMERSLKEHNQKLDHELAVLQQKLIVKFHQNQKYLQQIKALQSMYKIQQSTILHKKSHQISQLRHEYELKFSLYSEQLLHLQQKKYFLLKQTNQKRIKQLQNMLNDKNKQITTIENTNSFLRKQIISSINSQENLKEELKSTKSNSKGKYRLSHINRLGSHGKDNGNHSLSSSKVILQSPIGQKWTGNGLHVSTDRNKYQKKFYTYQKKFYTAKKNFNLNNEEQQRIYQNTHSQSELSQQKMNFQSDKYQSREYKALIKQNYADNVKSLQYSSRSSINQGDNNQRINKIDYDTQNEQDLINKNMFHLKKIKLKYTEEHQNLNIHGEQYV